MQILCRPLQVSAGQRKNAQALWQLISKGGLTAYEHWAKLMHKSRLIRNPNPESLPVACALKYPASDLTMLRMTGGQADCFHPCLGHRLTAVTQPIVINHK